MKYKTLVTGRNTTVIDDFFVQMDDTFEVISTSTRFNDIMRHIKYFNPDLLVYCLNNEPRESISQMVNIKSGLLRARIPVVVIGSKEECDEFEKIAVNVAKLVLVRPFTAVSVQEDILKFMEDRQPKPSPIASAVASIQEKEEEIREKIPAIKEKIKEKIAEKVNEEPEPKEAAEPKAAPEPQETSKPKEAPEAKEAPQPVKAHTPEHVSSSRHHILVVDDDPLMLKMLKQHLHDDYDVATAVSGKIAIKFLERKKTNLILLDYEMPGETGPEVLEKLRANDATKDIPVVFLTGVSEREKIQEALGLRPQGYLLKPIDHEKLLSTIRKVIG